MHFTMSLCFVYSCMCVSYLYPVTSSFANVIPVCWILDLFACPDRLPNLSFCAASWVFLCTFWVPFLLPVTWPLIVQCGQKWSKKTLLFLWMRLLSWLTPFAKWHLCLLKQGACWTSRDFGYSPGESCVHISLCPSLLLVLCPVCSISCLYFSSSNLRIDRFEKLDNEPEGCFVSCNPKMTHLTGSA